MYDAQKCIKCRKCEEVCRREDVDAPVAINNIKRFITDSPEAYATDDAPALARVLGHYGYPQLLADLDAVGIPTYATTDGWCYPLSNSAAAVAETLTAMLDLAGVSVRLKTKITDLRVSGRKFEVTLGGGPHRELVDRVIVASGGKAYPALGSRGTLFPVLDRLGHKIRPIHPALVPITAQVKQFHKLQGVRLDVGLSLLKAGEVLAETVGNMMFTQFGFSGPAPMNLSHLVSTQSGKGLTLAIDLLPYHRGELTDLIARMRSRPVPVRILLGSVLPPKIAPVVMPMADLPVDARVADLSKESLDRLFYLLTHLTVRVTGTRGFNFAQASTGGVSVREVDPRTMESRLVPGLHFAGEVLDVVGPCGGYNLQFAWTSGALAGRGAITEDHT